MEIKEKLFGIYDVDGTVLGEITYLFEKLVFRKTCSLCDITHGGTFQGKDIWKQNIFQIEWLHRDEQTESMQSYTRGSLPIVIRPVDGGYETVLSSDELATCQGDYDVFSKMLVEKL